MGYEWAGDAVGISDTDWMIIRASLAKPWPEAACKVDLDVMRGRGRRSLASLADDWGVSYKVARRIAAAEPDCLLYVARSG